MQKFHTNLKFDDKKFCRIVAHGESAYKDFKNAFQKFENATDTDEAHKWLEKSSKALKRYIKCVNQETKILLK